MAGDFDIRFERPDDANTIKLSELLISFDCIQNVPLILSNTSGWWTSSSSYHEVRSSSWRCISLSTGRHFGSRCCQLVLPAHCATKDSKQARGQRLEKIGHWQFPCSATLIRTMFCGVSTVNSGWLLWIVSQDTDEVNRSVGSCRRITLHRQRLALWMDDECLKLRRTSRMLEQRRLADDRQAWVEHERRRHLMYRKKERSYWSTRIRDQAKLPRQLWRSLQTLMEAAWGEKWTAEEQHFSSTVRRLLWCEGSSSTAGYWLRWLSDWASTGNRDLRLLPAMFNWWRQINHYGCAFQVGAVLIRFQRMCSRYFCPSYCHS